MLLISIPREFWIGAGLAAVVGLVVYLFSQGKKAKVLTEVREPPKQTSDFSRRGKAVSEGFAHVSFDQLDDELPRPSRINVDSSVARFVQDEGLVNVGAVGQQSSEFKIPAPPKGVGAATWTPAGQSITVSGVTLRGGMVYVGTRLPTPFGGNDPCLIDPTKPVANNGDYSQKQMGYWASYSDIPGTARRAYLNWLAGGRADPEAEIGFVFLFFYGLERRAIVDASQDASAKADLPAIAAELRRLLGIYGGKSGSFRRYASSLLDWVTLVEHPSKLYEKPVPEFPSTMELPLYVRLALGQASVDGVPVPVQLALSWARLDPSISLRTPATRCPEEFEQLFAHAYAEQCGPGIAFPRNRTRLKFMYQAASAGLRGYQEIKLTFQETPDVTVLTAPIKKLQGVVEAATKPLEAYSRLVGKTPEARTSLEGLLLLPTQVWPAAAHKAIESLKTRMGDGMIALPLRDLLQTLGASGTLTRDKTLNLARALESTSIGFEPDILSGAKVPKPEERVVLFSLPASEGLSRATGPYLAAALTLQLSSAVASADGEFGIKEMGHLRQTVMSWTHLTPSQTRRLLAHLRLLMQAPASLTALKKKFEPLELGVKETIAAFMATVAQSDGEVTPAEVKVLQKVYKALGVDSNRVFSDVHAVASGSSPSPEKAKNIEVTGFKLDPTRVAALQADTEKVSELLARIFTEADVPVEPSVPEPTIEESAIESAEESKRLMGLDDAHSALARMMLSRPTWSREELLDVAADLDLMLDGALEHINEAAFDRYDEPLSEGDDPVSVSPQLLEKLEA